MRGGFSFRSRVLFSFLLVVFLGLVAPSWYAHQVFTREMTDHADREARRLLYLVGEGLAMRVSLTDSAEGGVRSDLARVGSRWLTQTAEALHVRLALEDEQGERVFATPPLSDNASPTTLQGPFPRLEELQANGAQRSASSFEAAPAMSMVSVFFDNEVVFAAGEFAGGAGLPAGRLLLGMPSGAPSGLASMKGGFLLAIGAALVVSALMCLVLVRWLWRCMGETINVAEAIGRGEYRRRLGGFKSKEFDALARSINSMAHSIETQIRTITDQKTQLEAVLDSMREGVMVLDKRGRIRTVNKALMEIFPETERHEGKRPLEVVLSPELQRAFDEVLAAEPCPPRHNGEGEPDETHTAVKLQIEPERDAVYEVTIAPMRCEIPDAGDAAALAVFHDISDLSRLERVRRDFVANVSHELRTPLTSIKGYAETLLLSVEQGVGKLEGQKNFLEIIVKHANHMAKTVNDLLSLTRLESSGRKLLTLEEVDAVKAAAQALGECAHLVEAKHAQVDMDFPKEVMVMADYDRLSQVFRNLIENAVKYGVEHDGEQDVIRVYSFEEDEMVHFRVEDYGPGVPTSDMDRIFERFYRVEKHRNAKSGGSSGLGLAICKHIVEKHGGAIWVSHREDGAHGARFEFTIPSAAQRPDTDQPLAGVAVNPERRV